MGGFRASLVRLVQHQILHRAEVQKFLVNQGLEPQRCRHQHVDFVELVCLRRLGQQARPGTKKGGKEERRRVGIEVRTGGKEEQRRAGIEFGRVRLSAAGKKWQGDQ
jgi:hypothetical protein